MEYDNNNTGVIFKNDRKTEDTHADWSGNVNIEGKEYFVDAYKRVGKNSGKKFYSVRVKPKQPKKDYDNEDICNESNTRDNGFDSEVPF